MASAVLDPKSALLAFSPTADVVAPNVVRKNTVTLAVTAVAKQM
jgi:hypothetical protein